MPIQLKCPGCQTLVALPRQLSGKRVRCPQCNTVFSTPGILTDTNEDEAITARPIANLGADRNLANAAPFEAAGESQDVRLQLQCDGCGHTLSFAASEIGTVQECPECGGYIDVPEIGRPPTTAEMDEASRARTAREWELQSQETSRQQALNAKQIEQSQRALDRRDRQGTRYDELLDRFERVLALWEQLAEQARRVIENMGR